MPRGDGTGPRGQGPRTGRGLGRGQGRGQIPTGRLGSGAGPGGQCVCPSCGTIAPHNPGVPCTQIKCPKCGSLMVRE